MPYLSLGRCHRALFCAIWVEDIPIDWDWVTAVILISFYSLYIWTLLYSYLFYSIFLLPTLCTFHWPYSRKQLSRRKPIEWAIACRYNGSSTVAYSWRVQAYTHLNNTHKIVDEMKVETSSHSDLRWSPTSKAQPAPTTSRTFGCPENRTCTEILSSTVIYAYVLDSMHIPSQSIPSPPQVDNVSPPQTPHTYRAYPPTMVWCASCLECQATRFCQHAIHPDVSSATQAPKPLQKEWKVSCSSWLI